MRIQNYNEDYADSSSSAVIYLRYIEGCRILLERFLKTDGGL